MPSSSLPYRCMSRHTEDSRSHPRVPTGERLHSHSFAEAGNAAPSVRPASQLSRSMRDARPPQTGAAIQATQGVRNSFPLEQLAHVNCLLVSSHSEPTALAHSPPGKQLARSQSDGDHFIRSHTAASQSRPHVQTSERQPSQSLRDVRTAKQPNEGMHDAGTPQEQLILAQLNSFLVRSRPEPTAALGRAPPSKQIACAQSASDQFLRRPSATQAQSPPQSKPQSKPRPRASSSSRPQSCSLGEPENTSPLPTDTQHSLSLCDVRKLHTDQPADWGRNALSPLGQLAQLNSLLLSLDGAIVEPEGTQIAPTPTNKSAERARRQRLVLQQLWDEVI